jgi:hypothetical protein
VRNTTGSQDTKMDVDADEVILSAVTGSGRYLASAVNLTIDTGAASQANGLDVDTFTTGFWYVWVIYNSTTTTVAGLLSKSATAPAWPGGYDYARLVGEVYADATPHLLYINRQDDDVWYEDPQEVYKAFTLTDAYVSHALPATIPQAGICELFLEATSTDNGYFTLQKVSPDATTRHEVTAVNYYVTGYTGTTDPWGSAQYFPVALRMKHLGASTVYVKNASTAENYANQSLYVWGYKLPR